jgi:hypothetical protein
VLADALALGAAAALAAGAAAGLVATTATWRAGAAVGKATGGCAATGGVDAVGAAAGGVGWTTGSGAGAGVGVGLAGSTGAATARAGWTTTTGVGADSDAECGFVPCVNRKKTTSAATMPRPKAAPTRTALPEELAGAAGLSAGRNSDEETTGGTETCVWLNDTGRIGGALLASAWRAGGGGGLRTVGAGSDPGSDAGGVGTWPSAATGGGVPAGC